MLHTITPHRTGVRRTQWLRVALIVAAFTCALAWLAPRAQAYIYWSNPGNANTRVTTSIGRATLDGSHRGDLITGLQGAAGIAIDGSYIYWSDALADTIGRARLDGTDPQPNFITGLTSTPTGLAVDGGHIYWAEFGTDTIVRANLDGTGVQENFITGANGPYTVAVDSSHVYWTNSNNGAAGTIGRANLDGTAIQQDFITGATGPVGVAVDATHVYWSNYGPLDTPGSTIGRANLDGTGVQPDFITGATGPTGIAADGQHIYWTNFGSANTPGSTIGRADLDGAHAHQDFISGASAPFELAVDALPLAPSANIAAPAGSQTYATGQQVRTSFSCADGTGGPGIATCMDPAGFSAPQGELDTSAPGQRVYTVTATSGDGLTGGATVHYTVAGPPTASITTPADGHTYPRGQVVHASYACHEGPFGPGLRSSTGCAAAVRPGAIIDTTRPGLHALMVVATSADGQTASRTVHYRVSQQPAAAARVSIVTASAHPTRAGRIPVVVRCLGDGRCTGTLSLSLARALPSRRSQQTQIASGRFTVASRRSTTVTLGLSPTGRHSLATAAHGRISATATATVADATGSVHRTLTLTAAR